MSENCTHDCSSCSSNCSSRKKESMIKAPHKDSSIKKVIGVVSGKGGVGKSMTTALLASYAAKQGKSVGIMDADAFTDKYILRIPLYSPICSTQH